MHFRPCQRRRKLSVSPHNCPQTLVALNFSSKPYKWIRYATGVVLGAEGTLSQQDDEPLDLSSDLDTLNRLPEVTDLYYHVEISNEEAGATRRIFPLDPDFANLRTSTHSSSSCYASFRAEVSQRDGNACVLTNAYTDECDAAHIVPHCKGDEYIESLTRHRPQGANHVVIEEIDDKRNGLFLNKTSHAALGKNWAISRTPNFAMEMEDVIQVETAMPVVLQYPTQEGTSRFTAHLFNIRDPNRGALARLPPGSPIRVPAGDEGMASRPPDVLFDAVYASAVSTHFGEPMKDLREFLAPFQKLYFPPEGPISKEAERKQIKEERREQKWRTAEGDAERRQRHAGGMDSMDTVFYLWHLSAGISADVLAKRREEMAAKEREASVAKVESWRESSFT
ncbi:hypothetical protein EVG20_g9656 [Dentipellis fragilis]|uniref:HNH nuclease domain-containing protein n=1 Tax=Dentipellis fragilis TaxID=205917 RepID=A0A4Y9XYY1_9AGAM|nr:hypothetical protein EVG20_g9656 [Dentipellis fragilis]